MCTGIGPKTDEVLKKNNGDKWLLELESKSYLDLFDKDKLVYLSGDAEDDFDKVEEG